MTKNIASGCVLLAQWYKVVAKVVKLLNGPFYGFENFDKAAIILLVQFSDEKLIFASFKKLVCITIIFPSGFAGQGGSPQGSYCLARWS
jgi:hypothetical protein